MKKLLFGKQKAFRFAGGDFSFCAAGRKNQNRNLQICKFNLNLLTLLET
jgi:hypothetical protein